MGSRAVAAFRACLPDTYDGTVIQLVGEAMVWWRTIVATPLAISASPPPQPAISFTTARLAVMRVLRWKAREGEELESFLQRFIHEIVNASPIPLTEEEQCFHFWQGLPEQVRARVYVGTRLSFGHLVSEIYYVEMGLQKERRAEEERRELDQRTEARHQRKEFREDKHMMISTTFGTVDPHKGKAGTSHIYIDSDEDDDLVEFPGGHSAYLKDDRHDSAP
ncbi:hypothetical protein TIFTF001_008155 [Ficus carica]|uniref:Uncharacterized protein n=1 Tax=Ficus carica TaxID=3494 RepID=A0AA87ZKV1_FICCA|nr:hypothetical protein TIFTF001_008155 [Ficus carica]